MVVGRWTRDDLKRIPRADLERLAIVPVVIEWPPSSRLQVLCAWDPEDVPRRIEATTFLRSILGANLEIELIQPIEFDADKRIERTIAALYR